MKDQCRFCTETRKATIEKHHLVPRRRGGSDSEENLITVCANCHRVLESLYDKRFWERASRKLASQLEVGSDVIGFCPTCCETFSVGEEHDCSAAGEHFRAPEFESDGQLGREAQAAVAKCLFDYGVTIREIPEQSDALTYSWEWYRLRINEHEYDYNRGERIQ